MRRSFSRYERPLFKEMVILSVFVDAYFQFTFGVEDYVVSNIRLNIIHTVTIITNKHGFLLVFIILKPEIFVSIDLSPLSFEKLSLDDGCMVFIKFESQRNMPKIFINFKAEAISRAWMPRQQKIVKLFGVIYLLLPVEILWICLGFHFCS